MLVPFTVKTDSYRKGVAGKHRNKTLHTSKNICLGRVGEGNVVHIRIESTVMH